MLKSRIVLLIIAVILVALIFTLPKVVVDNKEDGLAAENSSSTTEQHSADDGHDHGDENEQDEEAEHGSSLTTEQVAKAEDLRLKLINAASKEKSSIFADSLAVLYTRVNKLDSAAKYTELASNNKEEIANAYYEAFSFAIEPEKANVLGEKARQYYTELLKEDASRLDLKTKIAMTYVSTENPMAGIMMLREVIEQEPTNEEALFNLGILSIQSGQHNKAIERFETLLKHHSANEQAEFYLALSYFNDGQSAKAKSLFEKIKSTSKDEQVLAAVDSYLNEL
jgi:tetratricopeptide (TPR) repeat protein